MSKYNKQLHTPQLLDTTNPALLTLDYKNIHFTISGGVNPESYMSLRVMLFVESGKRKHRKQVDLYSDFELPSMITDVTSKFELQRTHVQEAFEVLVDELDNYIQELREKNTSSRNIVVVKETEKNIAKSFLEKDNLIQRTSDLMSNAGVVCNEASSLVLFLTFLSRKLFKPLHAIVESKFDYLQSKIIEFIPEEDKKDVTNLTDNAVFYFDKNELSNKLLYMNLNDKNKRQLTDLESLQCQRSISKTFTSKALDGTYKTLTRTVDGPISLSIACDSRDKAKQNAIHSLVIREDNTESYEHRLINFEQRLYTGIVDRFQIEKNIELLKNIQRLIEPVSVRNPFACKLEVPKELQHKRISAIQYLRFIEVITLFKQHQKEYKVDTKTGEEYIETSIEDIDSANQLLKEILIAKSDKLNSKTREYFERLKKLDLKEFTNSQAERFLGVPISSVKRYHSALVQANLITLNGAGDRKNGYSYMIVTKSDQNTIRRNVSKSLEDSLRKIKLSSSQPKVAQNENELLISSDSKRLSEVAQKSKSVKSTKKKAS